MQMNTENPRYESNKDRPAKVRIGQGAKNHFQTIAANLLCFDSWKGVCREMLKQQVLRAHAFSLFAS